MKKPAWTIFKILSNTTIWAALCLFLGFHTGHKLGFHKGVMLTTELVLKIMDDKEEIGAKLSKITLED